MAAGGLAADHAEPGRDELRHQRQPAAHVDRRLWAVRRQQPEDARFVGREVFQDPRVRGMEVLGVGDVG